MVELYDKEYVLKNKAQKNLLISIFIVVAVLLVAAIVTLILVFSNEPINTPKKPLFIGITLAIAVIGICFLFAFYMLVYTRVSKYYWFLTTTTFRTYKEFKTTVINLFYEPQDHNGVDFYRLVVLEWSEPENDFVERSILVDSQKSIDDVKVGDIITVRVNANVLLAYQVGE